jgi:4-amino-4-deoxy-L-arabinose transferase-like glycosyltransferase
MALFGLYSIVGVAGTGATILSRKGELRILEVSAKETNAVLLLAIIIGFVVFSWLTLSVTPAQYDWMHDGLIYQQMAQSFLTNREFIVGGLYTHHFSPVFPMYLSLFLALLPLHLGTQLADLLIFAISLIAVFLVTKSLYGLTPAMISTGLVATVPSFIFSTSRNYAEPMVLILYTLTIFFIYESLRPEKGNRIILAGLFAGLGFLTKASLGYFFILTGIAGFLWRFYYMKWRVFKNKNYIIAIAVFFALLTTWTVRNLSLFWNGSIWSFWTAAQPSLYLQEALIFSITKDVGSAFFQFWIFAILSSLFFLPYIWILSPYMKGITKQIRNEKVSCLLLAILLPILIGLAMSSIDFVYENYWMPDYWISYYPISQVRYLIYTITRYLFIAIVPLSWLAYELAGRGKK